METPSPPAPSPGRTPRQAAAGGRLPRRASLALFFLAGGLLLAFLLLRAVGWPAIAAQLARVGWPRFVFLAALYAGSQFAFALGWWLVVDPRLPFSKLPAFFGVYLAGDAINYIAPSSVAGEPVKAHLTGRWTGNAGALVSLTIHKHADMLAQWIFVTAGVYYAAWRFPMPVPARAAAIAGSAALGGALLLLTWGLRRGAYGPFLRLLGRFRPLARRLERFHHPAETVDGRIRTFLREHPARYFASAGCCMLGWCGGMLETWLILQFLSTRAGWGAAFAIEALGVALTNMLLFIPGRVGGAEGVRTWIFVFLGFPPAQGVAYGLVRRGRELAWVLPGLIVLARERLLQRRNGREPGGSDLRRGTRVKTARLTAEESQP